MDFVTALKTETLIFDGAMGSELKKKGVVKMPLELANTQQPEQVKAIHEAYVAAGADVITTNTFRSITLTNESLVANTVKGIGLAKASNARFVALSMGPTGKEDQEASLAKYQLQAELGHEHGVDLLLLETFYDGEEVFAVTKKVLEVSSLPLYVTLSIQPNGLLFSGESVYPLLLRLLSLEIDGIGFNCLEMSLELVELTQNLRHLTKLPLLIQGNAGVPTTENLGANYPCNTPQFIAYCQELLNVDTILIGGCCGVTPEMIAALNKLRFKREEGRQND